MNASSINLFNTVCILAQHRAIRLRANNIRSIQWAINNGYTDAAEILFYATGK